MSRGHDFLNTYLLRILAEHTSSIYDALTIPEIIKLLKKEYYLTVADEKTNDKNISVKTLKRHLKAIEENYMGIKSEKKRVRVYGDRCRYESKLKYWDEHSLSEEAKNRAIYGLKIHGTNTDKEIKKVSDKIGVESEKSEMILSAIRKIDSIGVFPVEIYTILGIADAINKKRNVRFNMYTYNVEGNPEHIKDKNNDPYQYNVTPIVVVEWKGFKYLIGHCKEHEEKYSCNKEISSFRIDLIANLSVGKENTSLELELVNYYAKELGLRKDKIKPEIMSYINTYGERVKATFLYDKDRLFDVYNEFGLDMKREEYDEKYVLFNIEATVSALKYFTFSHLDYIKDLKTENGEAEKEVDEAIKKYKEKK